MTFPHFAGKSLGRMLHKRVTECSWQMIPRAVLPEERLLICLPLHPLLSPCPGFGSRFPYRCVRELHPRLPVKPKRRGEGRGGGLLLVPPPRASRIHPVCGGGSPARSHTDPPARRTHGSLTPLPGEAHRTPACHRPVCILPIARSDVFTSSSGFSPVGLSVSKAACLCGGSALISVFAIL